MEIKTPRTKDAAMVSVISLVAAVGTNREIGNDNKLLWAIPPDLRHFKELTRGRPLVMGRKTFDSVITRNGQLLPGRPHVVVTRSAQWHHPGVHVAHSVPEALELALSLGEYPFVIGGEPIFVETLRYAEEIHLTEVDDAPRADTYFPYFKDFFAEDPYEKTVPQKYGDLSYRFVKYRRIRHT